jgi:hypothetical protein
MQLVEIKKIFTITLSTLENIWAYQDKNIDMQKTVEPHLITKPNSKHQSALSGVLWYTALYLMYESETCERLVPCLRKWQLYI